MHCSPGRSGRAAGKREGENGLGEAMATETGHPWALRHPDAGIDAGILTIVTVTISPYSLCTEAAQAPYDTIESLRRLCGDCTEIARLPYNLRAASVRICLDESRRVHSKNRTIIVYYVNTYAVARSHIRCPKKPYGKSQTQLSHGARGKCKLGLSHTAAVWLAYVDTGHTATYLLALIEHKVTNMPLAKPINHGH